MRLSSFAWAAAASLAGALITTAIVVASSTPAANEDALARWLQDAGGWFEPIADAVRLATGTTVVLVLGAVVVAWFLLVGERRRALALAVVLVALPILQAGIKDAVDRERPSAEYVEVRASFSSPSYPSGHVMSGTLLWGYLAATSAPRRTPERGWLLLRALGAMIVVLGPPANVYLGVHWSTDVLGGLLFGTGLASLAALYHRR